MEALTLYKTKQELDESTHIKTVAYVGNDSIDAHNKVWLVSGTPVYKTLIHGWFKVNADNTNVNIISNSATLIEVRARQITKVTNNNGTLIHEVIDINPSQTTELNQGLYKVDYELLRENDGGYSVRNFLNNSPVSFLLVDGLVTRIRTNFPGPSPTLTGIYFTELYEESEGYTEITNNIERQLLEIPNTEQIIDLNMTRVPPHITNYFVRLGEESYQLQSFLARCPNIGNIDLSDNPHITKTRFILRGCSNLQENQRQTVLKIGPNITQLENRDQHKILRIDIIDKDNKESPFEWDSSINCIIARQQILRNGEYVDNNYKYVYTDEDAQEAENLTPEDSNYSKYYKKRIIDGGGVFPNDYLEIPNGYIIQNYYAFAGRKIDVLNMYNFDGITNLLQQDSFPFANNNYFVTPQQNGLCNLIRASDNESQELPEGFDCYWYNNRFHIPGYYFRLFDIHYTKTIILPKNINWLGLWRFSGGGWSNIEKIIVPNSFAPIVPWGREWNPCYGTSANNWRGLYGYCFLGSGDWGGAAGQTQKARTLYILKDTNNNIDSSWTNLYDRITPILSGKGVKSSNDSLPAQYGSWEDNGGNVRPNAWHDITSSENDPENSTNSVLNVRKRELKVFWEMSITALSQSEMDSLVNNIVSETLNSNQP